MRAFAANGIDAVVAVGGDGSLTIANALHEKGVRIVGVPKTIDNDLSRTVITFGFDTAVSFATECIDRLHSTAAAHRRVMVVEVMGRYAGWIALNAGVSGTAAEKGQAQPQGQVSGNSRLTEDERNTIEVVRQTRNCVVFVTNLQYVRDFFYSSDQPVPRGRPYSADRLSPRTRRTGPAASLPAAAAAEAAAVTGARPASRTHSPARPDRIRKFLRTERWT